jgi:hypothetical protein
MIKRQGEDIFNIGKVSQNFYVSKNDSRFFTAKTQIINLESESWRYGSNEDIILIQLWSQENKIITEIIVRKHEIHDFLEILLFSTQTTMRRFFPKSAHHISNSFTNTRSHIIADKHGIFIKRLSTDKTLFKLEGDLTHRFMLWFCDFYFKDVLELDKKNCKKIKKSILKIFGYNILMIEKKK